VTDAVFARSQEVQTLHISDSPDIALNSLGTVTMDGMQVIVTDHAVRR